jgi:hypothetical protein
MLFISFEGAPDGLDPVRLQKGMFLFERETPRPPIEKYHFRAYNYGPMSRGIYTDVDSLVEEGLVEEVPVEGQSWCRYRPTSTGVRRGHELLNEGIETDARSTEFLFQTKASVATMSFDALLENVYERYPPFAAQSVFRRRA